MNETEFLLKSSNLIIHICDSLETEDQSGNLDIDFSNNVLSIKTKDGIFVINRQIAKNEIWLSSPISGPYHFSHDQDNKWINKLQEDLLDILSTEIGIKILYPN